MVLAAGAAPSRWPRGHSCACAALPLIVRCHEGMESAAALGERPKMGDKTQKSGKTTKNGEKGPRNGSGDPKSVWEEPGVGSKRQIASKTGGKLTQK